MSKKELDSKYSIIMHDYKYTKKDRDKANQVINKAEKLLDEIYEKEETGEIYERKVRGFLLDRTPQKFIPYRFSVKIVFDDGRDNFWEEERVSHEVIYVENVGKNNVLLEECTPAECKEYYISREDYDIYKKLLECVGINRKGNIMNNICLKNKEKILKILAEYIDCILHTRNFNTEEEIITEVKKEIEKDIKKNIKFEIDRGMWIYSIKNYRE